MPPADYDYREMQKELGCYDCGECPRCEAKLHRCPFCGEKFCINCGWSEEVLYPKEAEGSG